MGCQFLADPLRYFQVLNNPLGSYLSISNDHSSLALPIAPLSYLISDSELGNLWKIHHFY
jgi:hypothetical protein